eukprot:956897-Rhodomonas_salina.2
MAVYPPRVPGTGVRFRKPALRPPHGAFHVSFASINGSVASINDFFASINDGFRGQQPVSGL